MVTISQKAIREDCYALSEKLLNAIKYSVSQFGHWVGDYPNWDEIVAVCNLETMLTFGVSFNETWIVQHDNNFHYNVNLDMVVKYIDSRMFVDGANICRYGEDVWDLFRLVIMIKNFNLEKKFSKFKKFDSYCRKVISNFELHTQNRWEGPAVLAVAYEYSVLSNLNQSKQKLLTELLSMRNPDFSWGPVNNPQLNVWHTSQALKALMLSGSNNHVEESLSAINRCIKSPLFEQDYFLRSYYLSYAGLGYIYTQNHETDDFHYIIHALLEISRQPYGLNDRGSSSMVAEMLSALISIGFNDSATLISKFAKASELEAYQRENIELKAKLEKLQQQAKKTENYVLINKTAFNAFKWIVGTIAAAIITAILTIWVTNFLQGGS